MKTLIVSNFRVGSWSLHDQYVKKGYMPLGEIGSNLDNDRKNKIEKFKKRSNVVGKLHPNQMQEQKLFVQENILRSCYRLCELADELIYLQREDTKQQIISFAVAVLQFNSKDKSPWLKNRNNFMEHLDKDFLDEIFKRLEVNQILIEKIYEKFPSKVITLEKDLPYEPYPNKYNYKGNWQPPYNFKLLGT